VIGHLTIFDFITSLKLRKMVFFFPNLMWMVKYFDEVLLCVGKVLGTP